MKNKITFILLCCFGTFLGFTQWQPINPGAGGQVQDVVPDPNQEGRLILASDMEGIYETTDNGLSWHIHGDLLNNRVYSVTYAPSNPNKLVVGTLYGLEVSDDGGKTFNFIDSTRKMSIASAAVKPDDDKVILAGIGWRDDYDFSDTFGMQQNAAGMIYRSTDGGITWSEVMFDNDMTTDRNVWTIHFDPSNTNIVYIGAAKGIFKSTDAGVTWTKISAPEGTGKNRGATISPNGKVLYASYATNGKKGNIYATSTASINWTKVAAGNGESLDELAFWYPEVDSRSTGDTHKLILSLEGSREGLFEGTFVWENDAIKEYAWKLIWSGTDGYDNGWDNAPPNPRYVHYTPSSWERAVWSTTNQTIFRGIMDGDTYEWLNRYSKPNLSITVSQWGADWPTYTSRGTESTYSYDIAVHDNYVVQGQGDNGAMESWDKGFSWSNIQHRLGNPPLSDVQAVDIGDAWGTPTVVAQMTSGYGGNAANGQLWAKKLTNHSPDDKWIMLAGGWEWKGGLASGVLRDVAISPAKPSRVYMFSTDYGLYMLDDIGWGISETEQGRTAWCTKISNGVADGIYAVKKIAPHPTNPDIVYMNGTGGSNQGVFKGVKTGDDWVWSKIYDGYGWDSEITAWEHEGQVYLYFSGSSNESGGDGSNYVGALSLDEGATWNTVITKDIAMGLRSNDWYEELKDDFRFQNKGGVAGYENQIIMSYYDHRMQKTYGIYKGTIDGNGNVSWEDWTGDIHFGGLTSTIVKNYQGSPYVYSTTAGAGAWRRPLKSNATSTLVPVAPTNLAGEVLSGTEIKLTWEDKADNEDGFRLERMDGDAFVTVATLDPDTTTFTEEELKGDTEYTYRIKAFNTAGDSDYSEEFKIKTTNEEQLCDASNLLGNGEFDLPLDGSWEFYNNTSGAGSATISQETGFSGANSVLIDIETVEGAGESDIQFFTALPTLKKGKTYQITFQAKAVAAKEIRLGVLKGEAPWTNYLSENITVSNEIKSFGPYSFTMEQESLNTRLDFFLGTDNNNIWIDNVVFQEKCSDEPVKELETPTKLTSIALTGTAVALSWEDNSEDETGFLIERKKGNGDYIKVATVSENSTTFDDDELTALTEYTYRIKAVSGDGESAYSNESMVTTKENGTGGCNDKNYINNGEFTQGVAQWIFYNNTDSDAVSEIKPVTGQGLSGDQAAEITIESAGKEDTDVQLYSILPTLKAGVTYELSFMAKSSGTKSIRVAVLKGEAPWTNFFVDNFNITSEVQTFGPFEFTMEEESALTQFHFFVGANAQNITVDAVSLKEKCESGALPPTAPSELTATTIDENQINLSWKDNSDNENAFRIERKTGENEFEIVATVQENKVSLIDDKLESGTAYTYRVKAVNSTGDSSYSNEVTATTEGESTSNCDDTNFIANGEFDNGVAQWIFYNNTDANTEGKVEPVTAQGLSGANAAKVSLQAAGASDSDVQLYSYLPKLEKGETYQLSFMAKASANKAVRIAVLQGEAPWANYFVENISITTEAKSFGPYEFTMEEESTVGQFHFFLSEDANDVTIDAVLLKVKCEEVTEVPLAPTDLIATASSTEQIDIKWKDIATTEANYVVERKTDGEFEKIASLDANTTTFSDIGLLPETEYTYRIYAKNVIGKSDYSNTASATTLTEGGIAYNNFSIESIGETCPNKENGEIVIKTKKSFNYKTTIAGMNYTFTDSLSVGNLAPGNYDFCISVEEEDFSQCYMLEIEEGEILDAQATLGIAKNSISINVEKGTAPFNVMINGKKAFSTSAKTFLVPVNPGDQVEVLSKINCEGMFATNLESLLGSTAYPNPTRDFVEISIPSNLKEVQVDVLNFQSQLLVSGVMKVENNRIKIDLQGKAAGIYLIKVQLDELKTFKIVKH
ncbi:fibronectin type III domain-containing protein [Galbibacter sp. BG1]|uniref:fibronectin type III domain-containing protein n=1 Tax=Galbibacter sp. BG1 TaxID=1170699 RepID=UPI0015B860B6|nr:fibronectin type III domain-containing protein [Galbibacter sp. BG1]QLE02214.1 fibronectin type III domain-containing protein [Galbibacter sp. BG1]